ADVEQILTVDRRRVVVRTDPIQVDGLPGRVAQATKLSAQEATRERAIDVELVILNKAESLIEVVGKVASTLNDLVARCDSTRHQGRVSPRRRLVVTEEHGR